MTMRPSPALVSILLVSSLSAQVPADIVERIKREGLENSKVMQFEHYLCNNIGARLTGSDNFTIACHWARDEFEKMGLEARLEKWGEWKIVWNRGQWSGRVLEPTELELQIATPAWTAPTKGKVAGWLMPMPKTMEDLERLGARVRDSYLYGRKPRGKSEDAVALREAFDAMVEQAPPLGYVTASRLGGVDKAYKNQIRVFGNSIVARGSWEKLPKIPQIVVRDDQARRIEKMLDEGHEIRIEFDIRNRFRQGPIELHNVVADLPGTEKPDEYVIVCGHLDSWHQAAGATDNGTGTTSTMEAARILAAAGARPKRTIRFLLWGGEEQGLLGSNRYVTMHRSDMSKVSAVFNHDSGTNWAHSLTVTNAMFDDFKRVLEPVMSLTPPEEDYDGPVFRLRKTEKMRVGGGSDHVSFQRAGVPAWSWGLRGSSVYGYGWHSQWDTYDIVVPEYQRHTATVIALTALGIADLPHLLPREGVTRASGGGQHTLAAYLDRLYGLKMGDGMKVTGVRADGPAARAKIAVGDQIRAVWGEPVSTATEMFGPWRENGDAETVKFKVRRGDKDLVLEGAKDTRQSQPSGGKGGDEKGDKKEKNAENAGKSGAPVLR